MRSLERLVAAACAFANVLLADRIDFRCAKPSVIFERFHIELGSLWFGCMDRMHGVTRFARSPFDRPPEDLPRELGVPVLVALDSILNGARATVARQRSRTRGAFGCRSFSHAPIEPAFLRELRQTWKRTSSDFRGRRPDGYAEKPGCHLPAQMRVQDLVARCIENLLDEPRRRVVCQELARELQEGGNRRALVLARRDVGAMKALSR